MSEKTPAETAKGLGNEAFSSKKFDEAITHYTKAIELDPENAVFFSNRSAAYASKQDWAKSVEDAKTCIAKDPKFVKGYYRLAAGQMELQLFDDANATLQSGLATEPDNDQLNKMSRILRAKRAAAASKVAKTKGPQKELDEDTKREFFNVYPTYKYVLNIQ
jgi:tetratricopeptide (TPR) repeat protein